MDADQIAVAIFLVFFAIVAAVNGVRWLRQRRRDREAWTARLAEAKAIRYSFPPSMKGTVFHDGFGPNR